MNRPTHETASPHRPGWYVLALLVAFVLGGMSTAAAQESHRGASPDAPTEDTSDTDIHRQGTKTHGASQDASRDTASAESTPAASSRRAITRTNSPAPSPSGQAPDAETRVAARDDGGMPGESEPLFSEPPPTEAVVQEDVEDDDTIDGGSFHVGAWSSDTAEVNAALRIGGDGAYLFAAGGVDMSSPGGLSKSRYQVGGGTGGRIAFDQLFVDLDLGAYAILDHDGSAFNATLAKARVGLGYRFSTYFAVYAGASANVFVDMDLKGAANDVMPGADEYVEDTRVAFPTYLDNTWSSRADGPVRISLWPGFYMGFEI